MINHEMLGYCIYPFEKKKHIRLRHKDYHLGEKTTTQNAPGLKFNGSPTCILFVYIYIYVYIHNTMRVCVCNI